MENWDKIIMDYMIQLKNLLEIKPHSFNSVERQEIPNASGIYVIFDKNSEVLYVGQSNNLRRRLISDHLSNKKKRSTFRRKLSVNYHLNSEQEISEYILQNCSCRYMAFEEPNFLEHFTISILKPKLNG